MFAVLLSSTSRDVYPDLVTDERFSNWEDASRFAGKIQRAQPGIKTTTMQQDPNGEWREYGTGRTIAATLARMNGTSA